VGSFNIMITLFKIMTEIEMLSKIGEVMIALATI